MINWHSSTFSFVERCWLFRFVPHRRQRYIRVKKHVVTRWKAKEYKRLTIQKNARVRAEWSRAVRNGEEDEREKGHRVTHRQKSSYDHSGGYEFLVVVVVVVSLPRIKELWNAGRKKHAEMVTVRAMAITALLFCQSFFSFLFTLLHSFLFIHFLLFSVFHFISWLAVLLASPWYGYAFTDYGSIYTVVVASKN